MERSYLYPLLRASGTKTVSLLLSLPLPYHDPSLPPLVHEGLVTLTWVLMKSTVVGMTECAGTGKGS